MLFSLPLWLGFVSTNVVVVRMPLYCSLHPAVNSVTDFINLLYKQINTSKHMYREIPINILIQDQHFYRLLENTFFYNYKYIIYFHKWWIFWIFNFNFYFWIFWMEYFFSQMFCIWIFLPRYPSSLYHII